MPRPCPYELCEDTYSDEDDTRRKGVSSSQTVSAASDNVYRIMCLVKDLVDGQAVLQSIPVHAAHAAHVALVELQLSIFSPWNFLAVCFSR